MKISELSTNEGVNVLCELSPYVLNITSDEELLAELKTAVSAGKTTTQAEWIALGVAKIAKLIPIIFKKRKDDVFGILAVMNGKSVEQVKKQNLLVTAKQIKELIKDKDLLDFFVSCADSEESE